MVEISKDFGVKCDVASSHSGECRDRYTYKINMTQVNVLSQRLLIVTPSTHFPPLVSFLTVTPISLLSPGTSQNPFSSKFANVPAGTSSHTQAATPVVASTVKFPVSLL